MKTKVKILMCMMFICGLTTLTKAVNHTFKVDDGIWYWHYEIA